MTTTKTYKKATSHGVYSCEIVQPWENKDDFNELHRSFQEELDPVGAMEEAAVFELAALHWKKLRLHILSQLGFRRSPDASALIQAGRNNGWVGIADHLANSVQDAESVRAGVRDVVKAWAKAAGAVGNCVAKQIELTFAPDAPPEAPTPAGPPASAAANGVPPNASDVKGDLSYDQVEKLNTLLKQLQICSNQIAPVLRTIEKGDLDASVCERAYAPEVLERELKLHADIDKRIEKTMSRLIELKEYKRMYTPKLVDGMLGAKNVPGSSASLAKIPTATLP